MSDLPALLSYRPERFRDMLTDPQEIVRKLDTYIIGQNQAKRMLAIAEFQRQIRVMARFGAIELDVDLNKQNVLMIGATGSGKTALVQAFAKVTGAPLTMYDVTAITRAGYIGMKIEDVLVRHVKNHFKTVWNENKNMDHVRRYLESGIIYLDEFDKIRKNPEGGNDVNGEAVQQGLLKVLEEGRIDLENKTYKDLNEFYTGDLLCICSGAFVGLEEIVRRRLNKHSGIGFSAAVNSQSEAEKIDIFSQVINEDLVAFGIIPEVLGRIPLLAKLKELTVEDLVRIITEPKNSLYRQYTSLFKVLGVTLVMEEDALAEIATIAKKKKTGARALKSILANLFEDFQYNIYDKDFGETLTITAKDVREIVNGNSLN